MVVGRVTEMVEGADGERRWLILVVLSGGIKRKGRRNRTGRNTFTSGL